MSFDIYSGISTLSLQEPTQPIQMYAPDGTKIFLHAGENVGQYNSFINAISDLAQAFKFLSPDDQKGYQTGVGRSYSNLDFSAEASDWNLLTGADTDNSSVLNEINSYFDWDAIKSIGSGQSYYQIAGSGTIDTFSDEQAFDLMCSMAESKDRVFGALYDIFGDPGNLTNDSAVIDNISTWLSQYTQVDPHNIGALRMFFGMQTDFINSLDAYMNSQTYWGGDNNFSGTLQAKAESYISSLSGDKQAAAESLEADWLAPSPRYDMVGDTSVNDLTRTSGSWVKFFMDKMTECSTKEIVRSVVCNMMNLNTNEQYNVKKKDYEEKKDDLMMDEIALQKIQAKAIAESRRNMAKLVSRRRTASVSMKRRSPSVSVKARPMAKSAAKPVVKLAGNALVRSAGIVAKKAPMVSRAPSVAAAPKAPSVYAKRKDEKKVI
jgi:hypothetical protein